jgi:hypothetical protein
VLDAVAVGLLPFEQAVGLELGDDLLAGVLAREADEEAGVADVGPAVLVGDGAIGRHHVDEDGVARRFDRGLVAVAEFVVVGIVRGRDLEEAGGHLGLGVGAFLVGARVALGEHDVRVFEDRDHAAHERQLANRPRSAFARGSCGLSATAVSPR